MIGKKPMLTMEVILIIFATGYSLYECQNLVGYAATIALFSSSLLIWMIFIKTVVLVSKFGENKNIQAFFKNRNLQFYFIILICVLNATMVYMGTKIFDQRDWVITPVMSFPGLYLVHLLSSKRNGESD